MLEHVGATIRILREKKGISLNNFAAILDVSAGYLSHLETGKTDNIPLRLLPKLQEELGLFSSIHSLNETEQNFVLQVNAMQEPLLNLHQQNPEAAAFLLEMLAKGLNIFQQNLK
ncbi:helix-turn-helix domain-containing protein [Bacillus sp. FF-1]|uniref:helix-turn-helix domain-containing protein n=1 Tax=Bacillus sp. FF-1 TaxID=3025192 RepID=UPI00234F7BF9|nr:helix-turn-helix transcriptional regulator [Bacillus sp. FF-1]MDC7739543.1 helix-turn-helix transcriptional regulator [Bacillus sp. FF-1]